LVTAYSFLYLRPSSLSCVFPVSNCFDPSYNNFSLLFTNPVLNLHLKCSTKIGLHLKIPAGYGEGNSYDVDLVLFATAFKINILTATYAIKTLEQEGLILFNDSLFKPSTVVFQCDKNLLTEFEQQYPAADPILKGLLRSYEGIFDFPAAINEAQLGKFISKSTESIIKQLTRLQQLGLIEYNKQKDGYTMQQLRCTLVAFLQVN